MLNSNAKCKACKTMQNAIFFCIFELNEIKSKSMSLQPSDSTTTHKQQPSKVLRKKRPNALISKQKIENEMTRTFSKIKSERVSGQKQREDTDSKSNKEDLPITQTHPATLNLFKKSKTQGIRDCSQ